jgi:hypothetical protein
MKKTKAGSSRQREQKNRDTPTPQPKICYTGLVESIMPISMEKRVSNHQMKDCRTFLRLQSAMGSSQGGWQGEKHISQGYQV